METTCDCEVCPSHGGYPCAAAAAIGVAVSTIPGSADGKIVRFGVCPPCYAESWADVDLSGSPWELVLRERDPERRNP